MVRFGDILLELRQDKRLSQEDLARALGVSPSSISAYERHIRLPVIDVLVRIAEYFGVTTDYLTGRTECNLPVSVFAEPYVKNFSVGNLVEALLELAPEQRSALAILINDMQFVAAIKKKK